LVVPDLNHCGTNAIKISRRFRKYLLSPSLGWNNWYNNNVSAADIAGTTKLWHVGGSRRGRLKTYHPSRHLEGLRKTYETFIKTTEI